MNKQRSRTKISSYKKLFDSQGFLVLPKFFNDSVIEKAQAAIEQVKQDRPLNVVIDNLENGDRTVLGLMSPESVKRDRMKINDLYLQQPDIRALALADGLVPILQVLLGHAPALCNSLYLEKGSSQDLHIDSLYMTPRTPLHLIATWVALEDSHEDAGELEYFPGSHLIEPMVFSNGGHHFIESEMPEWRNYIRRHLEQRNLKKTSFHAKKGDILFWHANLLHGGGFIRNPALTRKSCVFHYFSVSDAQASGYSLMPQAGAFWIDRAPQPLPHEVAMRLPFTEAAYLARYRDVAEAVKQGHFVSGKAHYDLFGKREGRLPC